MIGELSSEQRKDALYAAIESLAVNWWTEPASFVMFDSEKAIGIIANACKAAIAPNYDIVLIKELNTHNAQVIGKVDYWDTLKSFMSYIVRV